MIPLHISLALFTVMVSLALLLQIVGVVRFSQVKDSSDLMLSEVVVLMRFCPSLAETVEPRRSCVHSLSKLLVV